MTEQSNPSPRHVRHMVLAGLFAVTFAAIGTAWYRQATFRENLSAADAFIKKYEVELKQSFPSIDEVQGYTRGNGSFRILYRKEIDEERVRSWVAGKLPSIQIYFIRID